MKISEQKVKIKDLAKGFSVADFSGSEEDVYCYDGKLNCRPKFQRNFVYSEDKQAEVINTIFKGYNPGYQFPLSIFYWSKNEDGTYDLLDGQQRTLSILLFREGQTTTTLFNPAGEIFTGLNQSLKDWFDNYEITVYVCEADEGQARDRFEAEMMQWFTIINVAGEPLSPQELRNAIYSGTWVTDAKTYFSNEKSKIFRDTYSVDKYFKEIARGKMNRQAFLEYMLKCKSESEDISIETYMSKHRNDISATELFSYFEEVMAWVKKTFNFYDRDAMYGQDWCRLYNTYHGTFAKTATEIYTEFNELIEDDEIMKKDGIIKYILSGEPKYLNFRDFDDRVKKAMYKKQGGICPLCQKEAEELEKLEADGTKKKTKAIQFKYELKEMEADHIIPWSHGGKTEPENCCMLCKKHNRVKSDTFDPFIKQYVDSLY